MKYSKKKYLDYMVRTVNALGDSENSIHTFINNPGFGNIFDILKNEKYSQEFLNSLIAYVGEDYSQTIIDSLKKGSLNSFFTPTPIIRAISDYLIAIPDFLPKTILEPSAGNGLIIRQLLRQFPKANVTAFEKEILTARILEHNFKNISNVQVFGIPFESINDTNAAKNYDLVISNIPFGANKVFDSDLLNHPLRSDLTKNIHSYFIYKSLSLVKPSGLAVLICTKNFLDREKYSQIREHVLRGNNFLGAVRLPNNAFEQENTSVVTDILVFQNSKTLQPTKEQQEINNLFKKSVKINLEENEVQFSAYFDAHPEYVLGELKPGGLYNNSDYTVVNAYNIDTLEPTIKSSLNKFKPSSVKVKEIILEQKKTKNKNPEKPTQIYNGNLKSGNLIIVNQKIAKITDSGHYYYLKTKPQQFEKLTKIISLRDMYLKLLNPEVIDGQKILNDLNYEYDVFNFQFGNLNTEPNYHLVTLDFQGPLILALESPKNGVFEKSQFLIEPWKYKEEKKEILSLQDAIYYSLNKYNQINIEDISKVSGKTSDEVIRESLTKGLLFVNPSNNGTKLDPKYIFLSGNISEKIKWYHKKRFGEFQSYIDKDLVSKSILELEKIKPPITPFEDLDIKLHEPWFPIEITQSFIFDEYGTIARVNYNESTSKYMVKIEKNDYTSIKKFNVRSEHRYYGFKDILEGALNSTIPYITKGSKDYKRIDRAKMQEVKIKFELLYKEFNDYVLKNSELKKSLELQFYSIYDAKIMPKYDGSYLKFNELQHFKPYQSQKDTVAGIVINQGLLVNKEVGFGKTLDMALAAVKMKELNLSGKTLITGLKSTLIQLEKEFLNAFPTMRLLVANDKEISGLQKRNAFFAKIVTHQPDVVLMSHDTFKFIPQSPEVIKDVIQEELDNLEKDLSVIYENKYDINKRVLKGLEIRKENLSVQLQSTYHQIEKGKTNLLTFDQMGFEHIMVDESHKFKNLMYTTRHSRVAGLNTSKGSERSKNLYVAIKTLQKKKGRDFQATFLSGTPISNSITEVYVLFKYLIPNRLKEMHISSFDQWAQVFANKSYEFEPTVSGDYKVRERFRSFKKMKLLSSLYNEISIIVNSKTHQIDRPKLKIDVHTLKPTQGQLEYFEEIKSFLKTGNSDYLYGNKSYSEDQKSALSLIALHHMRHASIDPRLLNPDLEDIGKTKLRIIATEVYNTYKESNNFKGTQAVFSDLGTPKDSFNVYSAIKRMLIEEFDVPHEEIVFIHDFKTDTKRLECFKKFNSGKYRIIIGSTEKLGTGTNIQERLIRIHHVDIPHRPTDVDQRNGRGGRKGNIGAKQYWNNRVIVSFYIVENSTDGLMLNNVNTKKNFIEQITNGTIQFNKLDIGAVDDNGSIDYKTLLAVAKNDPLFLEKETLGRKLEELLLEQSIFKKNRLEAENNIQYYTRELSEASKNLEKLKLDLPLWNQLQNIETYYDAIKKVLKLPLDTKETDIGQAIINIAEKYKSQNSEHALLTMNTATLCINVEDKLNHSLYVKTQNTTYGYGFKRVVTNLKSMADYMYNALSKIPKSIEKQIDWKLEYEKNIKANQKVLDLDFDKIDDLLSIESRMVKISLDLDNKFDPSPTEEEKTNSKTLPKVLSNKNSL